MTTAADLESSVGEARAHAAFVAPLAGDPGTLERWAVPAVLLGCVVGATNLICMKAGFQAGWTPLSFGVMRFTVIGVLAALWLVARGQPLLPLAPAARGWLAGEAACKAVGAALIYTALSRMPATALLILTFTVPFFQMLMAGRWLSDRVEGRRALGMTGGVVVLLGVALWGDRQSLGLSASDAALGIGLALGGFVFTSAMGVCMKHAARAGADARQSVLVSAWGPAVLWLPLAVAWEDFPASLPAGPWPWMLFAWATTIAGILLFAYRRWLLARYRMTFLASFAPVARLIGLVLAPVVLGEVLPWRAVGALVLAGAVGAPTWRRRVGARVG